MIKNQKRMKSYVHKLHIIAKYFLYMLENVKNTNVLILRSSSV